MANRSDFLTHVADLIDNGYSITEALRKVKGFTQDFLIEVNKGTVPGHELVHKFGWRGNVSTNHHHIWNNGTVDIDLTWPTVAETLDLVSSDANDAAGGTGGRIVVLEGLDASFNEVSTSVNLNGLTAVTTTGQTFIRLNRAYVTDIGTYGGTNIGTITISGTDSGNDYGFLEPDEAQTQNTQYTIPAGKTGFILQASMTVEANKQATFHMHYRNDADDITAPFTSYRVLHEWDGLINANTEEFKANHIMPEKTDVWCDGQMSSGSGILQFDYDILLVENDFLP